MGEWVGVEHTYQHLPTMFDNVIYICPSYLSNIKIIED